MKHPKHYKFQWLNDTTEAKVTEQVLVSFSIGNYHAEVLCGVVPMLAGHLIVLKSLKPGEAYKDQVRIE